MQTPRKIQQQTGTCLKIQLNFADNVTKATSLTDNKIHLNETKQFHHIPIIIVNKMHFMAESR